MINWEALLEVYTLEEILELGDLSQQDVLEWLHEEGYLKLPEVTPCGLETEST